MRYYLTCVGPAAGQITDGARVLTDTEADAVIASGVGILAIGETVPNGRQWEHPKSRQECKEIAERYWLKYTHQPYTRR